METAFQYALEKVENEIKRKNLLIPGDTVLCALSGGADSVALAVFLKELSVSLDIKVCAAHLNHGIRGAEADRDEQFCAELCKTLDIPFVSEKADVPTLSKELGSGLEDAARRVRYEFLDRAAEQFGCNKICTAHHADDNIETVLLHMIRGSGLNGLKGISPVRDNIVRPLLALRKNELVAALEEKGYTFVFDSTNDDIINTRNYIRHKILPHIYHLNEGADKAFNRMTASLAEDSDYIEAEAKKIPCDADRKQLCEYHRALLCRYVRSRFENAGGKSLDSFQTSIIVDAIKAGETVKYAVSGGITAYISHSGLEFVKNGKSEKKDETMQLDFGESIFSPNGYKILITDDINEANSFTKVYKSATLSKVKSDKITLDGKICIGVRLRRSGDEYVFGKMNRNVRKQLINFKIPVQKRDKLPVFCVGEEIFLVHGLPLADSFRPQKDDKIIYVACAEEHL